MEEQKQSTYAKGVYFNAVKPETPEEVKKWKKGSLAIHIDNAIEYLTSIKASANEKGYVYHDLTKNEKNGEVFYSFRLNEWKPDATNDIKDVDPF